MPAPEPRYIALVIAILWAGSIPCLGLLSLFLWLKQARANLPVWRSLVGISSLIAIQGSWLLFLFLFYEGQIGGFGTHFFTTRSATLWFDLTLAACFGLFVLKGTSKIWAVTAGFLMSALWAGSMLVA